MQEGKGLLSPFLKVKATCNLSIDVSIHIPTHIYLDTVKKQRKDEGMCMSTHQITLSSGPYMYSSGHKKVYVIIYAVAIVRYNRKRNVHGNRRAVQRPCLI